ncbi:hypothetical protein D3C84_1123730 [compost metagenome]
MRRRMFEKICQIIAASETSGAAREHDHADTGVFVRGQQPISQLRIQAVIQCVELVGAVKRERQNAFVSILFDQFAHEMPRLFCPAATLSAGPAWGL